MWGVLRDGRQDLGRHRWDQGRFELPLAPVEVQRLVFAGLALDDLGRTEAVLATGRTTLLDILQAPPSGPLRVDYWATGRLSRLDELPWSGPSWAVGLGETVLLAERSEDCAEVATLLWDGQLRPGPVLPPAFGPGPSSAALEVGAMLLGGQECGGPDWAVLDPQGAVVALYSATVPLRPGAAVFRASTGRVLVAGGAGSTGLGTVEVYELDPSSGDAVLLGSLDRPRSGSAGAALTQDLVALVGGQTRSSTVSALSSVSFFSVGAGRTRGVGLELPEPTTSPSILRLASGSLLVAGGEAASAQVIVPELEPTRTATLTPSFSGLAPGPGKLVELGDGGVLWVTEAGRAQWLQLLPERLVEVATRSSGPWTAAPAGPGRALLVDGRGQLWGFDGGPQGLLSTTPSLELLGPDVPLGLVPLRPGAWTGSGAGVRGRAPSPFSVQLLPSERLLLEPRPRLDFEITVGLELGPQARASIVFGQVQQDFDHVVLAATPQVVRGPQRQSSAPLGCSPGFDERLGREGQPNTIRVSRRDRGREVVLDVGADGEVELLCETPSPRAGGISLAVINGEVRFFEVSLR